MATSRRTPARTTADAQRVYIYLQLPQSLEVVTAGYYEGALVQDIATGAFVYNPAYLGRPDAVPLELFELPLSPRRSQTVKLRGIFGCLRDASPDAWGRRIIEKHLGRADLTEADYLLLSPEDRAGALSFGHGKLPPAPRRDFNPVIQLASLLAAAERFMDDDPTNAPIPRRSPIFGSPARRWVAPGPRTSSRTKKACGSRSSPTATTSGTTPASKARC